ncbi:MAG: hypothetical protein M1839_008322 [Geoglossum umbratile]|nr:MAG: hypothetical protein M1839_008322 [Geoglossum umbratile]
MAITPLPAVDKDSPTHHILSHLQHIIAINPASSTLAFYDQITGFYSGKEKANSVTGWPGHQNYKTYSDFLNFPLKSASTRVGLFATFVESWVRVEGGWTDMDQHAWVGIVARCQNGKGKILVFWDPNSDEYLEDATTKGGVTWKNTLIGGQRRLVERCKERKLKVKEIWIGGTGNRGRQECLSRSLERMGWLAAEGGFKVDKLEEMGFTKL